MRVVITAPGLGDDIQAMKSGLLEIADVLVVNKGDREGAERTLQHLKGALSPQGRRPCQGAGAEGHRDDGGGHTSAGGRDRGSRRPGSRRAERRSGGGAGARYLIARAAADMVADRIRLGKGGELDELADAVLAGAILPAQAAARLIGSK